MLSTLTGMSQHVLSKTAFCYEHTAATNALSWLHSAAALGWNQQQHGPEFKSIFLGLFEKHTCIRQTKCQTNQLEHMDRRSFPQRDCSLILFVCVLSGSVAGPAAQTLRTIAGERVLNISKYRPHPSTSFAEGQRPWRLNGWGRGWLALVDYHVRVPLDSALISPLYSFPGDIAGVAHMVKSMISPLLLGTAVPTAKLVKTCSLNDLMQILRKRPICFGSNTRMRFIDEVIWLVISAWYPQWNISIVFQRHE